MQEVARDFSRWATRPCDLPSLVSKSLLALVRGVLGQKLFQQCCFVTLGRPEDGGSELAHKTEKLQTASTPKVLGVIFALERV